MASPVTTAAPTCFSRTSRGIATASALLHEVLPAHADPTRSTVDLVPRAATGAVLAPSTPVATPAATPGEAPPHFATLDEIGAAAERNLPADVWAYVEGGAEDEVTLGRNRDAFARRLLRPRVLTGVATPDLATTLLGMVLASPLGVAPFAGDTLLHPAGFRSVLRACAALGAPVIVPETSAESLEALRAAEPDAARIFQMSNRHPDDVQEALVRRAFGAGYEALCVTVDVPVVGVRRRELRHRFRGAERIEAANMAHTDRATGSPAWTWDRLAELIGAAGVPVIVKGIMCGADARAPQSTPARRPSTCRITAGASSTRARRRSTCSRRSSGRLARTRRSCSTAAFAAAAAPSPRSRWVRASCWSAGPWPPGSRRRGSTA